MEKQEIGKIYKQTVSTVYRYIYSRVGNRELTEDIVTDTYMAFMEVAAKYDGSCKIETFLIGIARNKLLQAYDKLKRTKSVNIDLDTIIIEEDDDSQEHNVLIKKLKVRLPAVFAKLKPEYRKVLQYRFEMEMSTEEIAQKLGISVGGVRVLQHRALNRANKIAQSLINN